MTPAHGPSRRASRRAGAGRASASRVAVLFDQHGTMVLGLCRLLLRDHHEAEDAAQQTFVSAYRSMLRGSEPRDPAPWLAAIARNECRARLRKRMRAPVALDRELENELADADDVVEVANRRKEIEDIRTAMADLPLRQREAVALRDFLGLSYEEVASTLSVSVPVVESLLFRARRRLREQVRTVPRYAAGVALLPLLAVRAWLPRDLPDIDSVRIGAGVVGGALLAVGAGVAKLVTVPFAGKAATATAVIVAGTVGVAPLLDGGGGLRGPGGPSIAPAPPTVVESLALPAPSDASGGSELAPSDGGGAARAAEPAEPSEEAPPAEVPPAAEPVTDPGPAAEPEHDAGEPPAAALEPDRLSAAADGPADDAPPPPPPPADAATQAPTCSTGTEEASAEAPGQPAAEPASAGPPVTDAAGCPLPAEPSSEEPPAGEPGAAAAAAADEATGEGAAPAEEPDSPAEPQDPAGEEPPAPEPPPPPPPADGAS